MSSLKASSLDDLRLDRGERDPRSFGGWLAGVILLLLLGAGAVAWRGIGGALTVRTMAAQEIEGGGGPRTVLNASGYVVARREATVSSKVTGKVIEVLIEEGRRVEPEQILARLDDSNVQASLRLAEAQLAASRAELSDTGVRLRLAEQELRRIRPLVDGGYATASALDQAETEVKSLEARRDKQQADVVVAERQVELWRQQLADTVIRAPFGGIVTSKNAQPGEMISPVSAGGGFTRTGIGTIVDMTSLEIEIDVNESSLNRVATDQAVEATLDAYPEWKIPAKVIAIIPTADRQKATVRVRVGFEKLDPRILPQMAVKVAFRGVGGPEMDRAVTVPKAALRKVDGRDVVYVVKAGRAERRTVRLGGSRGDDVTLLSGVTAGERVVVEGGPRLRDGSRVREPRT